MITSIKIDSLNIMDCISMTFSSLVMIPMTISNLNKSWSFRTGILLLFHLFLVAGKPKRTPSMGSNPLILSHQVGDLAVLFCSVNNLGKHTVTWRKLPNPSPLTIGTDRYASDQRLHAEHVPNSSQWNLVIENVQVRDQGQYECQVSHRKSHLRHRVTLQVSEKQEMQLPRIEISGENVIRIGASLVLTCNASLVDVGMEKLMWVKDGEPILLDHSLRHTIYTSVSMTGQNTGVISSKLQVKNSRVNDSGVYLCRSTERAQMAGVKVEVQGGNTIKRARTEEIPLREARDYYTQSSKGGNSSPTLHYINKWITPLCITAFFVTVYSVSYDAN